MYKFFQCQKQMFLDSVLEIYYDLLKNDQILLQCSLAGRYDNPILTRCLAPIDFFKIPAQLARYCFKESLS
jgi:hypothetical protein